MKKILWSLIFLLIIFFTGCSNRQNSIYIPYNYPSIAQTQKNYSKKLLPYEVFGVWYYPKPVYRGQVFEGIASWYGPNFHGKLTANGEIYNMYGYTAANKTMPMNTKIKVINLNNGKSVIVRINDRGPFVKNRILDLSYAAGKAIGINKTGTAPVKIIVLSSPYSLKVAYNKPKKTYVKIKNNYYIQVGAFDYLSGAKIFKQEFNKTYHKSTIIRKINGKYKVLIGGFESNNQAKNFKQANNIIGFIIKE